MTRREPTYLFGTPIGEPYVYTGPDYADELRDGADDRCSCWYSERIGWVGPCTAPACVMQEAS